MLILLPSPRESTDHEDDVPAPAPAPVPAPPRSPIDQPEVIEDMQQSPPYPPPDTYAGIQGQLTHIMKVQIQQQPVMSHPASGFHVPVAHWPWSFTTATATSVTPWSFLSTAFIYFLLICIFIFSEISFTYAPILVIFFLNFTLRTMWCLNVGKGVIYANMIRLCSLLFNFEHW